jgi:O-antigen ligase
MAAIVVVPIFALSTVPSASRSRRTIRTLALAFALFGMVLSGSVGALVAAVVAGAVWVGFCGVSGRAAILASAAALALFFFLHGRSAGEVASPFHRAADVTVASAYGPAALSSRLDTDRFALRRVAEQPVVGVGLDVRSSVTPTGFQVHNILLKAFYEAGFFGVLGMAIVLCAIAAAGLSTIRAARIDFERRLAVSLVSAYAGALTFGLGAPMLYQRYAWIPALLILALGATQARRMFADVGVPAMQLHARKRALQPLPNAQPAP